MMSAVRVYLDNCAFNRPFDDQSQLRVRLEAEAKLYVQEKIKSGELELVWSYILDIENEQNPFQEKKNVIEKWRKFAAIDVEVSEPLIQMANRLVQNGVTTADALHVAAAIEGNAGFFISTDDKLLKKLQGLPEIVAINPVNMIGVIDANDN